MAEQESEKWENAKRRRRRNKKVAKSTIGNVTGDKKTQKNSFHFKSNEVRGIERGREKGGGVGHEVKGVQMEIEK